MSWKKILLFIYTTGEEPLAFIPPESITVQIHCMALESSTVLGGKKTNHVSIQYYLRGIIVMLLA